MLGLIDEDLPYKAPLTYEPTPWDKSVAMALVRSAVNVGGFLDMTGAGVAGLLGLDESQEKFYKSYEDYIKPARERFTPDPQSTGFAGKVLGGLAELGPMMFLGPATLPTIIGSATMNTGADLVDAGVDAKQLLSQE
ncbi:MAG: hypothetical protein A2X59_04410 [Nitrospirae bacterium GWC2_42_7]|nr:MAG: hypothetical protein A2X59_04410 [Nitrospirae bacterium GWC2_42_7]